MPPHTVKSTQKAAGRRPAFLRISVVRRAARNINVGRYSGSELTPCLRLPGFPVAALRVEKSCSLRQRDCTGLAPVSLLSPLPGSTDSPIFFILLHIQRKFNRFC